MKESKPDRLAGAVAGAQVQRLLDLWIPAHAGGELAPFELMLANPKPHTRWHDDVDMVARALFACPVCDARRGNACAWAAYRVVPSWCAHAGRRRLVDRVEHAAQLRLWAFLGDG